jgi:hypothetical protein
VAKKSPENSDPGKVSSVPSPATKGQDDAATEPKPSRNAEPPKAPGSPLPSDKTTEGAAKEPAQPKELSWYEAISADDDDALGKALEKELVQIVSKHNLEHYEILLLFDDLDNISTYHSDRLYAAASPKGGDKDILLILQSHGGRIEPAYLISKTLKRLSANKFVAVVPRRAKSAATLIALGADEIHMGLMSQLGPIDPQLHGLPVLALANALDMIVDLSCRFPAASDMLTKYLADQVPIRILGYHQRVGESAVQYAERLLAGKTLGDGKTSEQVAKHLVNHYKDHDFVIDSDEATSLLGNSIVKQGTREYLCADEIYRLIDMVRLLLSIRNKEHWYVGSIADKITVRQRRPDQNK